MRVLQLVDSLEAGGTERMAVNLANGLQSQVDFSGLCTTRAEGPLKSELNDQVAYYFLNKSSSWDLQAFQRFYLFIKQERIELIHAHSSSFGLAVLMKLLIPHLKVVWHDHYGKSEFLEQRPVRALKWFSKGFNGSIAVNIQLQKWHQEVLHIQRVLLLPNFAKLSDSSARTTKLQGSQGKRLVCLANWRPQKDLISLLKAFKRIHQQYPDWSLHLVGKRFADTYQTKVEAFMEKLQLRDCVFSYGSVIDVTHVLAQASIGVLSSRSEGLPLSLLEYGQAALPVVVTKVGDCSKVVRDQVHGLLVAPEDPHALAEALIELIADETKAQQLAGALQKHVEQHFSEGSSFQFLLRFYQDL